MADDVACNAKTPSSTWLDGSKIAVVVFALAFTALLLSALFIGPVTLLQTVLDTFVPANPGFVHGLAIGAFLAFLMVVPIPIVFLTILIPGMIFGFKIGYLIVFCGLAVGSSLAFTLGRWVLCEPIHSVLQEGSYDKTLEALRVLEKDEDSLLLLVAFRFLCLPFFAKNYGPTILAVPVWKLAISALPHHLWVAFVFASLGAVCRDTSEILRKGEAWNWKQLHWQQVAPSVLAVVGSIVVGSLAYRMYHRTAQHQSDGPETTALLQHQQPHQQQQPNP
mmetsp:Transcript_15219/g.32815  ORF Transcript_15219/g.32815 Transcript_15219/m.32815 type:complete len:278 (+) Transcript_15219:151-984(+)